MDPRLRVGDAEREQASASLGDHYVQGRLSTAEHAERLDAVWSARTHGDLDLLFHDLPGGYAGPARRTPSRTPSRAHRRGPRGWVPLAVLALIVLTAVTHVPPPVLGLALVLVVVVVRRRRWAARQHPWAGPRGWSRG